MITGLEVSKNFTAFICRSLGRLTEESPFCL
jgi:hypothetical protein